MVEISFYLLASAAIAMLLLLFRGYSNSQKLVFYGAIAGWGVYLFFLERSEVLKSFEFPPRIPALVVVPMIILIIITVNRKFMKEAIVRTPLHIPIAMQSFRILVELLIYATYLQGIFPQRATFEGLNYDILVGISAVFISLAVYKGMLKPGGVLIWNFASMAILLLTVFSFIHTYYFTNFSSQGSSYQFVEFPYLLLASILLPVAIFLHAFSIKQVLHRRRNA